jgi:hypothetical protein
LRNAAHSSFDYFSKLESYKTVVKNYFEKKELSEKEKKITEKYITD